MFFRSLHTVGGLGVVCLCLLWALLCPTRGAWAQVLEPSPQANQSPTLATSEDLQLQELQQLILALRRLRRLDRLIATETAMATELDRLIREKQQAQAEVRFYKLFTRSELRKALEELQSARRQRQKNLQLYQQARNELMLWLSAAQTTKDGAESVAAILWRERDREVDLSSLYDDPYSAYDKRYDYGAAVFKAALFDTYFEIVNHPFQASAEYRNGLLRTLYGQVRTIVGAGVEIILWVPDSGMAVLDRGSNGVENLTGLDVGFDWPSHYYLSNMGESVSTHGWNATLATIPPGMYDNMIINFQRAAETGDPIYAGDALGSWELLLLPVKAIPKIPKPIAPAPLAAEAVATPGAMGLALEGGSVASVAPLAQSGALMVARTGEVAAQGAATLTPVIAATVPDETLPVGEAELLESGLQSGATAGALGVVGTSDDSIGAPTTSATTIRRSAAAGAPSPEPPPDREGFFRAARHFIRSLPRYFDELVEVASGGRIRSFRNQVRAEQNRWLHVSTATWQISIVSRLNRGTPISTAEMVAFQSRFLTNGLEAFGSALDLFGVRLRWLNRHSSRSGRSTPTQVVARLEDLLEGPYRSGVYDLGRALNRSFVRARAQAWVARHQWLRALQEGSGLNLLQRLRKAVEADMQSAARAGSANPARLLRNRRLLRILDEANVVMRALDDLGPGASPAQKINTVSEVLQQLHPSYVVLDPAVQLTSAGLTAFFIVDGTLRAINNAAEGAAQNVADERNGYQKYHVDPEQRQRILTDESLTEDERLILENQLKQQGIGEFMEALDLFTDPTFVIALYEEGSAALYLRHTELLSAMENAESAVEREKLELSLQANTLQLQVLERELEILEYPNDDPTEIAELEAERNTLQAELNQLMPELGEQEPVLMTTPLMKEPGTYDFEVAPLSAESE